MIECNPKQLYCTYRPFKKAPEVFLRVLASEQLRFFFGDKASNSLLVGTNEGSYEEWAIRLILYSFKTSRLNLGSLLKWV